jgi:hypothetical protein
VTGRRPPLRELQLRLRELIFRHGDGSEASLSQLVRAVATLPIRDDAHLRAGDRLAIYARMHFLRIRDVLVEDFPATCRAVGDDDVDGFVERYLAAFPTDDPSLRNAGRHLPRFLADAATSAAGPWQPDLARLEWTMIEAFDAADDPLLARASLAEIAPELWAGLRFETVRSLRVLALSFPVDDLRERLLRGDATPAIDPAPEPVVLRVWRQGFKVFHRRVDAVERTALDLIAARTTFAELCERLGEATGEEDATQQLLRLLDLWLGDELLVALPAS